MRRLLVLAAWAGVVTYQSLLAYVYAQYGTWWHYLLHQQVGWGVGLGTAAVVAWWTRYRVPAGLALVVGQLLSIVPDLQFRYLRMPHEQSMDLWLGHISIHTGPSPVLVALGALLLGGWGWIAAFADRRRLGGVLGLSALVLVAVACLLARDLPAVLADYPVTPPLPR